VRLTALGLHDEGGSVQPSDPSWPAFLSESASSAVLLAASRRAAFAAHVILHQADDGCLLIPEIPCWICPTWVGQIAEAQGQRSSFLGN